MKILTIASLTLAEAARKRIILAGVVLSLLFLALYATGAHFVMANLRNVAQSGEAPTGVNGQAFIQLQTTIFFFMGLFMANMIGALVAVFAACATISSEIEVGTLQSIAARPISRTQIVLGKWLGLSAMVAIYMGALFTALILIVYSQSGWLPRAIVPAGLVFVGESLVVLAATLFGSSFLTATVDSIIVLMLYMTSLVGGMMEQIGVIIGKQVPYTIGIITGLLMPSDPLYRYTVHLLRPDPGNLEGFLPRGADLGPFGAASIPSVWMLVYAALFAGVLLIGAINVFARRDL